MIEVVAALIRDRDRILICQRPETKARALRWEFPGGKVEAGETPAQALAREIREELAVEITVGPAMTDVVYAYPDIEIHLTLLPARIRAGTPTALEHRELRWVRPEELWQYAFCPPDQFFVKRLLAGEVNDAVVSEKDQKNRI